MRYDIKRNPNENEEQYLWRIGKAKDNGLIDLDWDGIADLMNKEFRTDESEYRTEAAYRKPYQQAMRFWNSGVFSDGGISNEADELRQAKQELRKEKQRMFDERTELNRSLRKEARIENDLAYLSKVISEQSSKKLIPFEGRHITTDNDMIICLSDFHIGAKNDNVFGRYDSDIAMSRLEKYYSDIFEVAMRHKCQNAYLILLGDLISGEIHTTIQLENREMLVEQVQKAGEVISEFAHALSGIFEHVYIGGVCGNHSRVSFKDDGLRGNKLDSLIPWYMKAALHHIDNISFIDENYDDTIGKVIIRGQEYWFVHGDYDQFNESGVSKLVLMIGSKPCGILMGHMHHNSYDDINGIKIMRSGSFTGTGDDYCITKRLYGKPSQMVAVVDQSGVNCCYPIDLE